MWWALLIVFGVSAGFCLVAYLVIDPPIHLVFGLLGAVLMIGAGVGVAIQTRTYETAFVAIVTFLGALGALVGGYWLGAAALPSLVQRPRAEPLSRHGTGHDKVAVVTVACGEPPRYHLKAALREVAALQQAADTHVPDIALPFVLASERARYAVTGGSPVQPAVDRLLDEVVEHLPENGFMPPRAAWCYGDPFPETAISDAVAAGARRVVVLPLSVAPSVPLVQSLDRVGDLLAHDAGIEVLEVPYLADLAPLDEHLADRIAEMVPAAERERAGVVLVGSGQPQEWDRAYPEGPDEEIAFMQRVRLALGEREFDAELVRLAWAEWRQPDVVETVRHLAALDCSRIVVVAACEPFPTLSTALDVTQSVRLARIDEGIRIDTLQDWGEDPAVAAMIAESVVSAVDSGDTDDARES